MTDEKKLTADKDLAAMVTGDGRPLLDLDEALTASVKADASSVNADAVIAEVEARRLELLVEAQPGNEMAKESLARAKKIAGDRRKRADKLMARAGIKSRSDLALDMRLWAVDQLEDSQRQQVKYEDRLANPDLFVVSDEEAILPRHHDSPPPLTLAKIKEDALVGRTQIQAYTEWLNDRLEKDGPLPEPDPNGLQGQRTASALRLARFAGNEVPEVEEPGGKKAGNLSESGAAKTK